MKGIGVSPGIAIGKAFVIKNKEAAITGVLLKNEGEIIFEIEQFGRAINHAVNEIEAVKNNKQLLLQDEAAAILETQIELLTDPQLKADVIEKIETGKKNANDAVIEAIANYVHIFQNMDDEYMRTRSADINDIGNRILNHLNEPGNVTSQKFEPGTIIIARDIPLSDTITMDINCVAGFATQIGSKTSHTTIIAKSKGIPAVAGCGEELARVKDNDIIILDGIKGLVHINPEREIIDKYSSLRDNYLQQSAGLKALKDLPAITTDGKKIILSANISGTDDMEDVFNNGGDGVGLFRTELLFMDRDSFPTEDEQFEFYKSVALRSKNKPIIVRTIDIGGDKQLPYFNLPAELNPFLGYRAIRICLDRKDLFITQLKAILRASAFGDLKIMFPMISNVQEIRAAKSILARAKVELLNDHILFNADIKVGIMIEVPSAAVTADILANEVDFFSIGTNDLCQYTLAVDRMNEKISHLYDPFNPGVLRLINNVIEQGRKHNIHVGLCGEMASDPLTTLLLLGMGLEDFSVSAASIPTIKNIIINNSSAKAKNIYKNVMKMDSSEKITTYLQEAIQ
jgi:phosphoenolpyruvate-protein phosphotransferase (PTS system enzyme I)